MRSTRSWKGRLRWSAWRRYWAGSQVVSVIGEVSVSMYLDVKILSV
jgi:hypothetical protein